MPNSRNKIRVKFVSEKVREFSGSSLRERGNPFLHLLWRAVTKRYSAGSYTEAHIIHVHVDMV